VNDERALDAGVFEHDVEVAERGRVSPGHTHAADREC